MRIQKAPMPSARVELLPLMDSMFLLLVFFIYVMMSMVLHRGIPLDLPASVTAIAAQKDYVSVSIDASGQVFVNKQASTLPSLVQDLRSSVGNKSLPRVYLAADKTVAFSSVVAVMDVLRKAEIQQLSLETGDPAP